MHPHDIIELTTEIGRWPVGTRGTVVDKFAGGVRVELVGPDGSTLDLLDVPHDAVRLIVVRAAAA